MSYIDNENVQQWLQSTKFDVSTIPQGWEDLIVGSVFGKLTKRYVTTGWTDEDSTPDLVVQILGMKAAAWYLRRLASEEDGLTSYADELDRRADELCHYIVSGDIDLTTETLDTNTALGGGPSFFPDDSATSAWEDDHRSDGSTGVEGAAPQVFTSGMQF